MVQNKISTMGVPIKNKDGISISSEEALNKMLTGSSAKTFKKILEEAKKEHSLNKDFEKDLSSIKEDLIKSKYLDENCNLNESAALRSGNIKDLKKWSQRNYNTLLEIADDSKIRLYKKESTYDDPGASSVKLSKIEIAEDDRVLGIPYAQAQAGDRVYIINGKVYTGWALYFSLSSIKSPEDYARNIDLVYNVPYLYSSILLKAQLGLGCGFDVNYGAEHLEVPEEKLTRRYLFKKLKIKPTKLIKVGFHLGAYGNAYWALRRDKKGIVDKISVLQPERLKIFLDPMTTKILFYIYLPPIIGGTTIATYPSDGRYNPNMVSGVTLSYPTPIIIKPSDMIHFKINDFTEYPFGFSDVQTVVDPATARLDTNILAPILYKKYTKPMVHWKLNTEGVSPSKVEEKQNEMVNLLENLEPGSDPITTDRWDATIISVNQTNNLITALCDDMDRQIFAATGVPESYFKGAGSTDRNISEQDKTFMARMKIPQEIVGDNIEEKLIEPYIDSVIKEKEQIRKYMNENKPADDFLKSRESYLADIPKYPEVQWKNIFKQDETQSISNAIALLNSNVIDKERAASKVGEIPQAQQQNKEIHTIGIDDPIVKGTKFAPETPQENQEQTTPENFNMQNNMQMLRGGLNVTGQKDQSNRNVNDVKDPSQLGGSRYEQHKLKGEKGDISQKHVGLEGN